MSDSGKIYLSSLSSKHLELAKSVNKDGNEYLSGDEVSIFLAECELNGMDFKPSISSRILNTIFTIWDDCVDGVNKLLNKETEVAQPQGATHPPKPKYLEPSYIINKTYENWAKVFKDSPLKEEFFIKLYDVMERLNIKEESLDIEKYDSLEAQAFNGVVAILAKESQLKPDCKYLDYRGLFQLATLGLTDIKKWVKENPDKAAGLKIDQNINIEGFAKLTGEEQLDYLVAYIEKMKEYSGIGKDERITPAQMGAMIKKPFDGKLDSLINEKNNEIKTTIKRNKVETRTIVSESNNS